MHLRRSSRLAFLLLKHLADRGGRPLTRRELGHATGVKVAALAEPLAALARAGILRSVRGPRGGFKLARDAGVITLREVIEAAHGPVFDDACLVHTGPCFRHALCPVHSLWRDVQESLLAGLGRFTLHDLIARLEGAGEIDRFLASLSESPSPPVPAPAERGKGVLP